ncbi:AFR329Cp [Eremothecium gossypii ATCC 10895]|uniref:CTP-dependent diacylglycerol kinase 1 n=1 Tax=Eremothecium gossypii (strain ATCC 10895 / CBS 109.51 / FGSC 9923 / NRRL Y-1056) TaxID=284811 RepID=DGK1_EREGS|nr:AFR329Cp [Eremothecium gossypii ATCC 10895]Q753I3.1 RecName: Full=CTP-dependent diacylglycerol kinase 1; AltName: Full=Diglyceride kinase 1; Short=DAG kinase 1 [Eremothecium gossypii ATCC 10895]AAS53700.1 AFR329Cp [Eremothecium gossypii ATCC 10895]AEY98013.1 FAFR329Cp [Eremothecium gossypii FDAG1]
MANEEELQTAESAFVTGARRYSNDYSESESSSKHSGCSTPVEGTPAEAATTIGARASGGSTTWQRLRQLLMERGSDVHLPVTEIHLKSQEWFGDFITKHEVPRKVFHSSIGFFTLALYVRDVDYRNVRLPLIVGFVHVLLLDVIRLHWPAFNTLYCQVTGLLMRKKEVHTYNGVLWYLLGLIFAFSFFSKDVALVSLFLLSWCDTAASTVGRLYGHLTPRISRNKSLAGSLAAFVVGVISCAVFYGYFVPAYSHVNHPGEIMWNPETSRLSLVQLSLLGGFVASLSEGIDLFNWDDNFTIPVLSAIFMHTIIAFSQR